MAPARTVALMLVLAFVAGAEPDAAPTGPSLRGTAPRMDPAQIPANATSSADRPSDRYGAPEAAPASANVAVPDVSINNSTAAAKDVAAPEANAFNVTQGANSSALFPNLPKVVPVSYRAARAFVRGRGGGGGQCFPGMAEVVVKSKDEQRPVPLPIGQLQVGQEVLVEAEDQTPKFELVLGFLHFAPGASGRFHVLFHAGGQLRATAEHIVFVLNAQGQRVDVPMKEVRVGDQVLVASQSSSAILPSPVLAVREDMAVSAGMFAPLTASGSIIVDQTVASVYAGAPAYRSGPHAAYHALFFGARLYHRVLGWLANGAAAEEPSELHPAARIFEATLGPFFKTKALALAVKTGY